MGRPDKRKIRTEFRKHHESRTRKRDLRRDATRDDFEDSTTAGERLSGKGRLTRKRTIVGDTTDDETASLSVQLEIDETICKRGRVLRVFGLSSLVEAEDGRHYRCAVRRLLKTLSTDQRHVVAAGDCVWFRPESGEEGFIERVEPRRGILCRTSKGRRHVIVANVDQLLIVTSAAEPSLKPNLIDRFLVTAEKARIRPVICVNKIDLVDPADLMPLVGTYGQMGYDVLLVSATTGFGIERLREIVRYRESVLSGQSGVGKSSLLNAIEPALALRVRSVSEENQKGRHTTTTAQLIPLAEGGYLVDTPGIRQLQLWDVIPEEVAGYFRELRPYVNLCRFPDCTHMHEADCAVKDAVADGRLDARRYESYCQIYEEPEINERP
ncbi:MAG: ribosome small subunit-dependent GTPase A [Pirellulaceae bacterium]